MIKFLIILNVFLSAYWLILGDIRYDVDISRDFLLIKEMVSTKPFTLIGSHTSIGGVFHGPLWYYLNLPAFFIANGNPVLIGWFWWLLSILTLIIFFFITQKLFNKPTAYLATLLYSANAIINPVYGLKMFFPPYGAVLLAPVFFYLFVKYLDKKNPKILASAIFILGLIIQFEMAFGIPILVLTLLFIICFIFKNKLFTHFLFLPIILLPLSTFIIFDLKHDFLQTFSLIKYLQSQSHKVNVDLGLVISEKIRGIFSDTFLLLTQDNRFLSWVYSILFLILILIFKTKMKLSSKRIYFIFLYFYFGYWLIHLSLKPLWSSYFWPLLPLIIMLITSFFNYLPKKLFFLIYIPLLFWNMYLGIGYIKDSKVDIASRGKNSWAFNKLIAETIFKDANEDFGYFIFTPERWIYQSWYAMDFVQIKFPNKKSYPFVKKGLTYIIILDPSKDYPDPVSQGWRITDLKIKSEPKEVKRIDVVEIQKYFLTDDEIKALVNPYLLNSTFFR